MSEPSAGVTKFFRNVCPGRGDATPPGTEVGSDDTFDLVVARGTGIDAASSVASLVMDPGSDKVRDVALDPYRPFGANLAASPATTV